MDTVPPFFGGVILFFLNVYNRFYEKKKVSVSVIQRNVNM